MNQQGVYDLEEGSADDWPTCDLHTSSDEYAGRFSGKIGEWLLERQKNLLIDELKKLSPASVLDVGGGHGQVAYPVADIGVPVTVVGSSPACAAKLEELIDRGDCKFVVGNFYSLPFPDRSFDIVICIRQLCHVENWQKLLNELCRVAKTAVIVDYPPRESFNIFYPLLFPFKLFIEKNTRPFQIFSHSKVCLEFEKNYFPPQKRYPEFFIPIGIHRMLHRPRISQLIETFFSKLGFTRLCGSPVLLFAFRRDTAELLEQLTPFL